MNKESVLIFIAYDNIYVFFEEEIYCYEYISLDETMKEIFNKLNLEKKIEIKVILHFEYLSNLKEYINVFKKYNTKGIFSLQECLDKKKKYILVEDDQSYIFENGNLEKNDFNKSSFEENQDFEGYIILKDKEDVLKIVFNQKYTLKKNYFKKMKINYEYLIFPLAIIIVLLINSYFNIDDLVKEKEKINLELIQLSEEKEEEIVIQEPNIYLKKDKIYEDLYEILSLNASIDYLNMIYENEKWDILLLTNNEGLKVLQKCKKIKILSLVDFEDKIKIQIEYLNKGGR